MAKLKTVVRAIQSCFRTFRRRTSSQPGKWRLTVDLSGPEGKSVNDGTETELCSLQYLHLDAVIEQINRVGHGALLAKMDIESAYRIIPVYPDDRALLGVQWKGEVFFDLCLPFGLRSAPKIFTAVANALLWVFQQKGVSWVDHYWDDFITTGPPGSQECQSNKDTILGSCERLGVPIVPEKCTDPSPTLVFLGFELDTIQMVVRLSEEKLQRIRSAVREWAGKKACKKKELESLLGHLQHAATVVRPGHAFVRRVIELLSTAKARDRWIRLNADIRADL